MPAAQTLRDLIRIRNANRNLIDSINGNLGSALGFKKPSNQAVSTEPAVLVFVPRKVDPNWIPGGQLIPETFLGPDNLECPVDVVEGQNYEETFLWTQDDGEQLDPQAVRLTAMRRLLAAPPLAEHQLHLREQLRGWHDAVTPGSQLAGFDTDGNGYFGTLGAFARDVNTGARGFITNQHVADHVGNVLRFPVHNGRRVGEVVRAITHIRDDERFANLIDEPNAHFRVDCAFAELHSDLAEADIDRRLPTREPGAEVERLPLGNPVVIDLDSMFPVGQRVLGVGRTRSMQRGTIHAFAYEFVDESNVSIYTDFLIEGDEEGGFSAPGDSGKLIVADDDQLRPIGLLWGGWQQRLHSSREQEKWSYGIDINVVLDRLGVEIEA